MEPRTWRRVSEAGAMTSAGMGAATILCCLPFSSGVVGGGGAAVGAPIAPLRSYFISLSLACLAYAFYQTYRPGAAACDEGGCDTRSTDRRRQFVLFGMTALVLLLLTSSWWANWIIYWML